VRIWNILEKARKIALDKIISGFTNSKIVRIEKSGHFLQEEEAKILIKSIFDFMTDKKNHSYDNKFRKQHI
jgi:pimeloyl-ACP methyl ester carboxylesterase